MATDPMIAGSPPSSRKSSSSWNVQREPSMLHSVKAGPAPHAFGRGVEVVAPHEGHGGRREEDDGSEVVFPGHVRVDLERDRRLVGRAGGGRCSPAMCRRGIRRPSDPGRSRRRSRNRCRRPPFPPGRAGSSGGPETTRFELPVPNGGAWAGMGGTGPGSWTSGVAGPERRKALGEPMVLRFCTPQLPVESVGPGSPLSPLSPFGPCNP